MRKILVHLISVAIIFSNPYSSAIAKDVKSGAHEKMIKLDKPIIKKKETTVRNPEKYIAQFLGAVKSSRSLGTLGKIASASSAQKSAWLLDLPSKPPVSRFEPVTGTCVAVLVVVVIFMVVGYIIIEGVKEEVIERVEEEQEVLKCFGYD